MNVMRHHVFSSAYIAINAPESFRSFYAWSLKELFPVVAGVVGVVWSLLWYLVVASSPEKHWWISEEEKLKILEEREGNFDRDRYVSLLERDMFSAHDRIASHRTPTPSS